MKSPLATFVTIQFTCDCIYSLIMQNKTPVHSTWGLLRVCAACSTPRLNLSSEPCPSWNNIQDTFLTGSPQDTTPLPYISGGFWLTLEHGCVICMNPTAHTALYISYCDVYYIFQEAMNQGTSPFCLTIYPCTPVSLVACLTWNSERDVSL